MGVFSTAVIGIMVVFAIAGIIDSVFLCGKLGLAEEFSRGLEMIGPLCTAIVGIISLVPALAWVIERTLTPLYASLGLDPSMAVTSIIAIDMGGFQLAESVALDPLVGEWAGIVYGSMMGATIVFSIPVGLAAIRPEDKDAFSKGILYGIAAIPVGTFAGGLIMGVPLLSVLKNIALPVAFSALLVFCLARFTDATTRIFAKFSGAINVIAMLGLALAMVNDLILKPLGFVDIPFFRLLAPTGDGIAVAGAIGLVLAGALPFVKCLNRWLDAPLKLMGKRFGMTDAGITGFLLSAANNMAMFATLDRMNEHEKILNTAFAVCAAFVIGDHLAFAAANAPACIAPMMAAKLLSGIVAVALASAFNPRTDR